MCKWMAILKNKKILHFICLAFFTFFISTVYGRTELPEKLNAPRLGNYALPGSQQVFPLVAFGQAVMGANVLQLGMPVTATVGSQNNYTTSITADILWGITDYLSLYVALPVSLRNRSQNSYSSGLNDMLIQFEGALLEAGDKYHAYTWTLVGNVTAPFGSIEKNPPTGFGATSFFVGSTFSYLDPIWYAFASSGLTMPLKGKDIQSGNQFLYQAGVGRNIPTSDKFIFSWILEFDGIYTTRNKINGVNDPNSGSNLIYMTPSLYLATRSWIFQLGAGYPIIQTVNGNQSKQYFLAVFDLTYTIS